MTDRKPGLGEDNEEKVLNRLGVTYGVLRRLGFTEDRVEECLKAIIGVDLEEAFDWVRNTIASFSPYLLLYSFIFIALKRKLKWESPERRNPGLGYPHPPQHLPP